MLNVPTQKQAGVNPENPLLALSHVRRLVQEPQVSSAILSIKTMNKGLRF